MTQLNGGFSCFLQTLSKEYTSMQCALFGSAKACHTIHSIILIMYHINNYLTCTKTCSYRNGSSIAGCMLHFVILCTVFFKCSVQLGVYIFTYVLVSPHAFINVSFECKHLEQRVQIKEIQIKGRKKAEVSN